MIDRCIRMDGACKCAQSTLLLRRGNKESIGVGITYPLRDLILHLQFRNDSRSQVYGEEGTREAKFKVGVDLPG